MNRPKTVLHTIGIGGDIDEEFLKTCAEYGSGEFCKANDLSHLLEFYSTLAQKFKIITRSRA